MGQFENSNEPKTFRELARMPERLYEDRIVLGDSFFFDPFIIARTIREADEKRLAAALAEVQGPLEIVPVPTEALPPVIELPDVA